MKKLIIISLAAFMISCTSNETPEALKQKLTDLKDQQLAINHEIKGLEKKLETMETSEVASNLIPVLVQNLQSVRFEHYILVNGKVEPVEEAQISPETNGQIKSIHVIKGQRVNKGDLIISLNASIIENGIAEIKLGLDLATKIYEKQKELWDKNIGSELQYLEAKNGKESLEGKLKTLKSQLDMSFIKAPFSGIVDDIFLKEGELASPGRPVLYLVNLEKLKIVADLSENLLSKIKNGDMVKIEFPSYSTLEMDAPIYRIANAIHSGTRTIEVEIRIDNVNGQIKPNQMVALQIRDFVNEKALVVPSLIVKQDSKGEFLFMADKNTNGGFVATKVYVKSGLSYNDKTVIEKGLNEGQNVIISGFNQIGNGSLIEIR